MLCLLHHWNNIKITNCCKYELIVNDVFSRNNLSRIKDRAYVINLDDKNNEGFIIGVSLFIDENTAVYSDYFGMESISQEVLNKIKDT